MDMVVGRHGTIVINAHTCSYTLADARVHIHTTQIVMSRCCRFDAAPNKSGDTINSNHCCLRANLRKMVRQHSTCLLRSTVVVAACLFSDVTCEMMLQSELLESLARSSCEPRRQWYMT